MTKDCPVCKAETKHDKMVMGLNPHALFQDASTALTMYLCNDCGVVHTGVFSGEFDLHKKEEQ